MQSISRRSLAALAPALIAAATICLTPASVAASTQNVKMNDGYSYDPVSATVALGTTVHWHSNAASAKHDVNATQPNKLFSSGGAGGIHPG